MTRDEVNWRRSLRALFAMEAASLALMLPRIPDIRDALGLTPSALGLALLGIPLGSLAGFPIAPRIVQRVRSSRAAWSSVTVLAAAFVPVAAAGSLPVLFASLAVVGLALTHTEIALNAQASHIERQTGRQVMSSSRGFWSLGSIGGVLAGGLCAQAGMPVVLQAGLAAALLVSLALMCRRHLGDGARFRAPGLTSVLPSKALLPLCLLPVGIMAIEGIFMDWSALFLIDELRAGPFAAALGYLSFSMAMAVARLGGDAVTARLGPARHLVASTVIAGLGATIFALSGTLVWAVAAAFLAGLGVAAIYPIALSLAGQRNGAAEENIAAVSFTSFLLLVAAPPLFGWVVELLGWRNAFLVAAGLALPTLLLSLAPGGAEHRADATLPRGSGQ